MYAVPKYRLDAGLTFGPLTERVFWFLHTCVRELRSALISISYSDFREAIWGSVAHRNWTSKLKEVLSSLTDLRIGEYPEEGDTPSLDDMPPLFQEIRQDSQRKQYSLMIAEGFLGSLEACSEENEGGIQYNFGKRQLSTLRKRSQLIEVYLPAYLGSTEACRLIGSQAKCILPTIVRELTYPSRKEQDAGNKQSERSLHSGERIRNAQIRSFTGKTTIECLDLDEDSEYVGFNGNGILKGMGYRLSTWRDRSGYQQNETARFLSDLALLGSTLDIVCGALDKRNKWYSLEELRHLQQYPRRNELLESLHMRVYARHDFLRTWNAKFGWSENCDSSTGSMGDHAAQQSIFDGLRLRMARQGLKQKDLAAELGVSKQYVSRMMREEKCSEEMLQLIAEVFTIETPNPGRSPEASISPPKFEIVLPSFDSHLHAARDYLERGWAVIPMMPGTKRPYIKWKQFQTEFPSSEQIDEWWTNWPDAGIAVVLGDISNLIVADVDGEVPHRTLMELLGAVPKAPTVKSGSDDPFRYHLFFRHPSDVTSASSTTPWNERGDPEKLELRGTGGILVLPPSLHKSGQSYCWVKRRSLSEIDPPELPKELLDGLVSARRQRTGVNGSSKIVSAPTLPGANLSQSTLDFLEGGFSQANGSWNNLLFKAACDFRSQKIPLAIAEQLILSGAKPASKNDQRIALDTIRSAYSEDRKPSRY